MSNHENHAGFTDLGDMMKLKKTHEVEMFYGSMGARRQMEVIDCLSVFEQQRKKKKDEYEAFEKQAKKYLTLKKIISEIKVVTVDEESTDGIFSSADTLETMFAKPTEKQDEKEVISVADAPRLHKSLMEMAVNAVGLGGASKKRKGEA